MNIKLTIWTATTDGDNCPVLTTAHATKADAEARVRDDIASHSADEPSLPGDASGAWLVAMWERVYDGVCIIQSHEVEFDVPEAWEAEYDPESPSAKAVRIMLGHGRPHPDGKVGHFATAADDHEHWVDFTYRTRSGSLGHWGLAVTAKTQEAARELAEFEFRKKHRGEITDVKITTRPAGAQVGGAK